MARIAIYDSGVGGLSIYQNIRIKLPGQNYLFVSDNAAYPYGTKSEAELQSCVLNVTRRIIDQFDPDLLVIACNTASTVMLPQLRDVFKLPIVGVVPAIKPAAIASKSKVIGLLATPATIRRDYTDQLIDDFAADCEVIQVGSSKMVDMAEQKLRGQAIDLSLLKTELDPILARPECDVLILACTHFPLLYKELSELFEAKNHQISLLDSGPGIANRVVQLLQEQPVVEQEPADNITAFTAPIKPDSRLAEHLRAQGFGPITVLN